MKTIEQLQKEISRLQNELILLERRKLPVKMLKQLQPGAVVKLVEGSDCNYRVIDVKGFPQWCRFLLWKDTVYPYPETKEVFVVTTGD